jgi:hypothetical protein
MTRKPPPAADDDRAQWRALMAAFDRYREAFGQDDVTLFGLNRCWWPLVIEKLNEAVDRGRRTSEAEIGMLPLPPGAVI